ncbi:helicase-related protein [Paenibacillus mucilaginosus]|uniref:helicase-related protein n=1 Tax=Paenibacillus mucilaginosus TaxID=61624 RepID=UPI0030C7153D
MLPQEAQDAALAPCAPGTRKVVLATSIAESSLTVEGVRVVIDSGLMRVPRFSPRTGMSRLETVSVSAASADQRRGRAGRLAPGVCYRLWSEADHRQLPPQRVPEIREAISPRWRWSWLPGARAARTRCRGSIRRRPAPMRRRPGCSCSRRSTGAAPSRSTAARWRLSGCTRAWRTCCCAPKSSASAALRAISPPCSASGTCSARPTTPIFARASSCSARAAARAAGR